MTYRSGYIKGLEEERRLLSQQRVNRRAVIDKIARGHRWGDEHDTLQMSRDAQMRLKCTQRRWEELHHLLGLEHKLGPAVKLDVPAAPRVRRGAVSILNRSLGYQTEVMMPSGRTR